MCNMVTSAPLLSCRHHHHPPPPSGLPARLRGWDWEAAGGCCGCSCPLLSAAVAPGDLVALELRRSLGLTSSGKVFLSPWHPHPTRSKLNLEEEGFTTILQIQKPQDSPRLPLISSPLPFQRIKGAGREITVSVLPWCCEAGAVLEGIICLKVPAQWVWELPGLARP